MVFVAFQNTDFWETFLGSFICSHSFCQTSTENKWPKKYFFLFSFWCLKWIVSRGLTSKKQPRHLLHYGDFVVSYWTYSNSMLSFNFSPPLELKIFRRNVYNNYEKKFLQWSCSPLYANVRNVVKIEFGSGMFWCHRWDTAHVLIKFCQITKDG